MVFEFNKNVVKPQEVKKVEAKKEVKAPVKKVVKKAPAKKVAAKVTKKAVVKKVVQNSNVSLIKEIKAELRSAVVALGKAQTRVSKLK